MKGDHYHQTIPHRAHPHQDREEDGQGDHSGVPLRLAKELVQVIQVVAQDLVGGEVAEAPVEGLWELQLAGRSIQARVVHCCCCHLGVLSSAVFVPWFF